MRTATPSGHTRTPVGYTCSSSFAVATLQCLLGQRESLNPGATTCPCWPEREPEPRSYHVPVLVGQSGCGEIPLSMHVSCCPYNQLLVRSDAWHVQTSQNLQQLPDGLNLRNDPILPSMIRTFKHHVSLMQNMTSLSPCRCNLCKQGLSQGSFRAKAFIAISRSSIRRQRHDPGSQERLT